MNNTYTGLKRQSLDKFYTKSDTAKLCIEKVKQHLEISPTDLIIEPSCGNGVFIEYIKTLTPTNNYLFYDIEPHHPDIIKQDYLELLVQDNQSGKIHIIGNPPYGRQSSTAIKFIKKSCNFCDTISFILSKSFKKQSMQKRAFPLNFHLIYQFDLPFKSFIIDYKEHDVPCVFQIWKKQSFNRVLELSTPHNYIFVKKHDNPDISVRRVGINAGHVSKEIDDKNPQTHYFIKFSCKSKKDDIISILSNVKFEHDNTVGAKSISKQELIKMWNNYI